VSGVALAKRDIQAGNYRILYAGDRWPEGQSRIDEVTGYRVELAKDVDALLSSQAITAYDSTMRDWYRSNH